MMTSIKSTRSRLFGLAVASVLLASATKVTAQEFRAGEPIGAVNEAGARVPMSANVKVYGSFHFSESCTFAVSYTHLTLPTNA